MDGEKKKKKKKKKKREKKIDLIEKCSEGRKSLLGTGFMRGKYAILFL